MKKHNLIPKKFSWGIVVLITGTACFFASHFYGLNNIFISTGVSIFTSLALFVIFYAFNISNNLLVTCGIYSMIIYCLHNYTASSLRVVYRFTGLSYSASPVILFATSCACSIMIPFMLVWLYKNVKCLRWIEYVFYPGKFKAGHA